MRSVAGRDLPRMATITASPTTAPTLAAYADERSETPLLILVVGEEPVYADVPGAAALQQRIGGLVAHEVLQPGWERDAGVVRDLGRLLAATHSVTFTEGGQAYRVPAPMPELGWFFRTSLRGNIPLTIAAVIIAVIGTVPVAL